MDLKIGADPELFLQRKSGEFVGAHEINFPGTKEKPFPVKSGALQIDGFALEFNIDAANTRDEWLGNIKDVYHEIQQRAEGYNVVAAPCADFNKEYFDSCSEDVRRLGCDPDYNAYTGAKNSPPQGDVPFRTASGHVHIGWTTGADPFDQVHFEDCRAVIKQLDYALGCNSLLFDKDNRRRSLYGKAGAFRPKSYGVEYRVLSNVWLTDEALIEWVYDTTTKAVELLGEGTNFDDLWGNNYAASVIDRNYTQSARDISTYLRERFKLAAPPTIRDRKVA